QVLKQFIECHEDLDERQKQEALKCIEPYEKKVRDMYGLQENVLKQLLTIVERAGSVGAAIGSPDAETNFALKWQLEDLRQRIIGQTTSKAKQESCTCSGTTPNRSPTDPPCGREISEPSVRLLPIRAMIAQNNQQLPDSAYYAELKKLYEAAASDSKTYGAQL